MKFEAEGIWATKYKTATLSIRKSDGRRIVTLMHGRKCRTTVTYARYLVSIVLGRILDRSEHVDHKDGDKTNDSLDNLRVLTASEHAKRHWDEWGRAKSVEIQCPICGVKFLRTERMVNYKKRHNKKMFCSISCAGRKTPKPE